jgi:transposase InsO family protein
MAINRQFHGAPGPWRSARDEQPAEVSLKHLPYRPTYRHHMWFTDIRYLVQLDGRWVYSICVIEGYSRKILAGMVSPHQDLTAILQLLYAALSEYGCPQALVSDNGSVFTAGDYLTILRALEIEPLHIEKGKPWQNLIEAQFKVQLRLADCKLSMPRLSKRLTRPRTGRIATAARASARPWPSWVGSGGAASRPSGCASSLGVPAFCARSTAMASSVYSVSTSMRNMASPGNASRSGFTKAN